MVIQKHIHPDLFWNTCGPVLMRHEDRNNLIIGLANQMQQDWEAMKAEALLYSFAQDEVHMHGANHYHSHADPPFLMAISTNALNGWVLSAEGEISDEILFPVAHSLKAMHPDRKTVVATGDLAERFAKIGSVEPKLDFEQLLYRCDKVIEIAPEQHGRPELATMSEANQYSAWLVSFFQESLSQEVMFADAQKLIQQAIGEGRLWVWMEDQKPRSMVVVNRPTVHGCALSYVYTPEEHRRKGYAKSLTASVTKTQLSSGKEFVVLYTDASHDAANAMYLSIGFGPIAKGQKFSF